MSAVESADLQKCSGENLASQSDQPGGRSVLPPFTGKLSVDEGLKLSRENFKQSIEVFFKDKHITPLSQLTATPAFPTPHVLAQFASKTYTDYKRRETDVEYETRLELPDGWKLLTTAYNGSKNNGYFGTAYWHPEHQQVVIAHRGTNPKILGALWADVDGVVFKNHVPQMGSACTFAHKVVEVLREVNRLNGVSFQLFFTGHSLGGWLAQITTFTTEYLKIETNNFLKRNNDKDCCHPHTVVFESPGCKDMLSQMTDKFDVRLEDSSIELEHLDISSYLSAPNRINTCNTHLGTVYRIFTDLSDMGWWKKHTALYNTATHSMDKIVQAFDPETGQVLKDEQGQLKLQVVIDWPISAGLTGGAEYNNFFKWAENFLKYHPDTTDESFRNLNYSPIRYQTKRFDERVNSFSIFSAEEREFLQSYHWLRQWPEFFKPKDLFSLLKDNQAQEQAEEILHRFDIENDRIRCANSTELQALIAYVKRLLQLFPEIKENTKIALSSDEVRNRVYQFETRRYIKRVGQSPLEFSSDASSIREFLESEQHQVLNLQMVKGDEWTGIIKVHQVLQKTGLMIEGQYTILNLKRLLTLNQLMDLSKVMQSTVKPYLLLLACEDNQILDEEIKDVIRTLFDTIKQKPNIKTIFVTRSGGSIIAFLHHLGKRLSGKGFVTRVEELTWSDFTTSSQENLLQKSVKFQGAKIPLNELMSAESPVANFLPLGALLEEKELKIADPVQIAISYNEGYYIGRTLRHQEVIKGDIFKHRKDFPDLIAGTEKEFKELCQQNPNSNVHWLQKDKSGKLLWQQSQGSLETVRRYIDTDSSHTHTDDDLVKLLEQAQHQRVMLISDTAGMGKSTVLTHLSKKIKENFPTKWMVRIKLNEHTNSLKALKKEKIDKEKAIEFISEKMLKLKPGLEIELFKRCCEQKQKIGTVIMLDGFDEISPFYEETVIDLLQALKQTAVEQLWVTTRPHLREELEDKLQQLSYTLEPFSEENQVEFLTKFWRLQDWFSELDSKEKEESKIKLEICGKTLIKKLGNSISDKDREFTGIPLQTLMLAEAFDEEVKKFCHSVESTPDLPFQLDLLGLYGRFIERKYEIFQEEKFRVPLDNVIAIERRESDLKVLRKDHQLLALKVLFSEKQVTLLESNSQCTFTAERLERIGIMQINFEGKLQFIHRTFAEYYVAVYLVNRLTGGNKASEQVQDFILREILIEGVQYRVIRVFVDGLLSRCKVSNEVLKEYGNRINDLRTFDYLIIKNAALEGDANIIGLLLDSLQAAGHTDTVKKLLLAQSGMGGTVWHSAVVWNNIQVLERLWEWAKGKLTEDVSNEMLFVTDGKGRTVWHVAAEKGNVEALQKVWEWANEKLTTEEIRNKWLLATDNEGRTVWHLAAEKGNLEALEIVWEWATEKLTTEEINNELLLATDAKGRTVWHMAADEDNLEAIEKVWEWANEKLTTEEINNKLLFATDDKGRTVWHVSAKKGNLEILQKVWDLAKEKLTTEEINNKLLLAKDVKGRTVWHVAAEDGNLEALKKVWDWGKEKLASEEVKEVLLATDNKSRNLFCMTAERYNVPLLEEMWEFAKEKLRQKEVNNEILLATDIEGNLEELQKVLEWSKQELPTDEINNKFLLATDKKGRTVWHVSAKKGNLEALNKLWDWAEENLTTEEINNKFLLIPDIQGRTVWHVAAQQGNLEVLQKVWDWAKEKLTTEDINKKLLLASDDMGRTLWHVVAAEGNLEALEKAWEWANEKLTTEEINSKWLLALDCKGRTVWHLVAEKGDLEALQKVWECANEKLTTEEINNKLLLVTNDKGMTVWHVAAKKGNLEVLQKIWEWANEKLTTEEMKTKFLLLQDFKGRTVWHLAAQQGSVEALQKIWDWANDKLTTEEINTRFLLATDDEGKTVWQVVAESGNLEALQKIWEWAKERLTTEEINNKLLLATDDKGRTVWHVAPESGNLEAFQKIWEWAKERLRTEEINKKLLYATDVNGSTICHVAAERGNIKTIMKVWQLAKENLTTEEINNKLLLATDDKGRTVWHVAEKQGCLGSLQQAWDWDRNKLTEEINNKLLLATDSVWRTFWSMAADGANLDALKKILE